MRFKLLITLTLLISMLFTAKEVSATPITDTVTLGGEEWAQVDLFNNVSWSTLNVACPTGICLAGSSVNGHDLDGWRWATSLQVMSLFESISGLTPDASPFGTIQQVNSTWVPLFLTSFRQTFAFSVFTGLNGLTSTLKAAGTGGQAQVRNSSRAFENDYARTTDAAFISNTNPHIGAFLYKATAVPEPTTLAIFTLGLMGIAARRFKKKS